MATDLKMSRLTRRSLLGAGASALVFAATAGLPGRAEAAAPEVLKMLFWQAVTMLNPHFAIGPKDQEGCRLFYEPLAVWNSDGDLEPILADGIPTVENGRLAEDLTWVVWTLKPGVKWHDGEDLTADDLVFTWEYARDPATAAVTIGSYRDITVEKIDDLSIRVVFAKPTPYWANAFVGNLGLVLPEHVFGPFKGAASKEAPANLVPVGTGPYKLREFRPGDLILADRFEGYHVADLPKFKSIEVKGGGDAVSAARAVLQTGEYHFALNTAIEEDLLARLEAQGRGEVIIVEGGDLEMIQLNFSDSRKEENGERSIATHPHPILHDARVREALSLLVDRASIQQFVYGRTGIATSNFINSPARYVSPNTEMQFDPARAETLLEQAGWFRGADGIRAKDGLRLSLLFQTTVQSLRQRVQAVIKQSFEKAGIEVELKAVAPAVFFSSDEGNPDTNSKFYADMQMYTTTMYQPDPERLLNQFASWEVASKANQWRGRNFTRWQSPEFDDLYRAMAQEIDPQKRAEQIIGLNDLVVKNFVVLPLVGRPSVGCVAKGLQVYRSAWDNALGQIARWHFSAA